MTCAKLPTRAAMVPCRSYRIWTIDSLLVSVRQHNIKKQYRDTVAGDACSRSTGSNIKFINLVIWIISPDIRQSFLLSSENISQMCSTEFSNILHFNYPKRCSNSRSKPRPPVHQRQSIAVRGYPCRPSRGRCWPALRRSTRATPDRSFRTADPSKWPSG